MEHATVAKKLARLGTSGAFCWLCCTRGHCGGPEQVPGVREIPLRARAMCRTRSPAASTDVQTPNLHSGNALASAVRGPRTRSGRPCRPSTRLNPAMEHTDSIERDSEHTERRRRCALLRDLTESDRALLESRLVDGWDYTTIARRLGIPRADLVKRVQRIRTGLRQKAKALGAGETRFDLAASMPD